MLERESLIEEILRRKAAAESLDTAAFRDALLVRMSFEILEKTATRVQILDNIHELLVTEKISIDEAVAMLQELPELPPIAE